MPSHSDFVRFVATLAAGMILLANDAYARGGGGGGSGEGQKHQAYVVTTGGKVGSGGNTQGTPPSCKGPACNVRVPAGPIYDPTLGAHGHHGGGGGGHGCGSANGCQ
jgi:hypothetical protein